MAVPLVIAAGEAGSGKTLWACEVAAALYKAKWIRKIVITRPTISTGESIGFLPGSTEDKMAPWVAPMIKVLTDRLGVEEVAEMKQRKLLEVATVGTLRGTSWKHTLIICDEAQNLTQIEVKMLVTRVGYRSKLVLAGDT